MANRTKIKAMAKELNLQTIVNRQLKELSMGNLDYLQLILEKEVESRKQNSIAKIRKFCSLPSIQLNKERLHEGVRYQVEKLLNCEWIEKSKNLLIIGECNTGKTALANYLANNAVEQGLKVFYIKADELLVVLSKKEVLSKAQAIFNKIRNADLLVLDEVLYLNIDKENLELFYKTIMLINETTSIVFITNREISDWLKTAEEKYTMQLLISRALADTEVIRL